MDLDFVRAAYHWASVYDILSLKLCALLCKPTLFNHKLVYKDDHGSCSHVDESEKVWNVNVYLNSSELKIDIPIG